MSSSLLTDACKKRGIHHKTKKSYDKRERTEKATNLACFVDYRGNYKVISILHVENQDI
jgi:hypothetical protein